MKKQTILIVDDEIVVVQSIKDHILEKGDRYIIKTSFNGKEALDILKKEKINLMILDLNMPVLDGIQLLTELYNRNIWLPVIILTKVITLISDNKGDIFGDFGIVDYIEKPINFDKLDKIIEEVLNRFEVIKESASCIDLHKILLIIKMERRTGVLTVKFGKKNGKIFFKDGDVVDAEVESLSSEESLEECLKSDNGEKKISLEYINHRRENKINKSLEDILRDS